MASGTEIRARLAKDGADVNSINLFFAYHLKLPHVWEAFEKVAVGMCEKGLQRLSAKAIGEDRGECRASRTSASSKSATHF